MRVSPTERRRRRRRSSDRAGDPRHPARRRRPPARGRRSVLDPRPDGGARVRASGCWPRRDALRGRPRDRDARLLREAAHHRRLEGPHQRPAPRRQLRHQRGPAPRARAAAARSTSWACPRHRVPRPDLAAVHRRPHRLGRDRRAHHREPDAPRARLGPVDAGRASRTAPTATSSIARRRDRGGAAPHHFLVASPSTGTRRDRPDRGQRGLPRDPARRQAAPNYDAGERRRARAASSSAAGLPRARHDRLQPRQQRQGPRSGSSRSARDVARADRRRRRARRSA